MLTDISNLTDISTETFVIGNLTFRRLTEEERVKLPPRRPRPNRDDAESFLSALDPAATWWTFQLFDDNRDRMDKSFTRIWHGSFCKFWSKLVEFNKQGAGVYLTINETDGKGRTADDIVRVRAVFVDIDDGRPLPTFHIKPHIVVESSPGKWHLYWRVRDCTIEQYRSLQTRLIAH